MNNRERFDDEEEIVEIDEDGNLYGVDGRIKRPTFLRDPRGEY